VESVLVTGGAGYIGSHTTRWLLEQGYKVTVVDDLSQGHADNVPEAAELVTMSLFDTGGLAGLMAEVDCAAVLHFAASASVAESMREPTQYFSNNVAGSLSLLHAMVDAEVRHIVFSSSAAVYGNSPQRWDVASPIRETDPIQPINPYGASKAIVEMMLHWFDVVHGITSVCLRYFNAAGADPRGHLCEEHEPETHLIPLLLRAVATGQPVTIFGNDYDTADGTCVRDFIHVEDLAQAHTLALDYLLRDGESEHFNVGTGVGHSILETIAAVQEVTGKKVPYVFGPRRAGDPPSLIAAASKIKAELGWTPQYPKLRTIVEHAWRAAHLD
jgi:UDP-glucose 4-epimerase